MHTTLNVNHQGTTFTSILNGLITGAFTLAVIGGAAVLTFAQYLAVA